MLLTDGPFIDSKEHLAGLFLIEAGNLDGALAIAGELLQESRHRPRCPRRHQVTNPRDTRNLADRRALPRVEQPRPQLDRLVTLTARLPPGQREHRLGHDVEDEGRARKPFGDAPNQLMDFIPPEVHQHALAVTSTGATGSSWPSQARSSADPA
jgi:hypothetical protein